MEEEGAEAASMALSMAFQLLPSGEEAVTGQEVIPCLVFPRMSRVAEVSFAVFS